MAQTPRLEQPHIQIRQKKKSAKPVKVAVDVQPLACGWHSRQVHATHPLITRHH